LLPLNNFMSRRPAATKPPVLDPLPTDLSADEAAVGDITEKKWQVDGPSGVPAPVIRTNMISLRLSYQGRVKVAFFEQD
jgi:hypothetical protein